MHSSRLQFAITLTIVLSMFARVGDAADNATEPISPQSTIPLFNGSDLTGLYTFLQDTKYEDPRQVFSVDNGMLIISGDGLGGIITNDAFENYRLILEFKWGPRTWGDRKQKARDSGILVHCQGKDGAYAGIWMNSIESQLIDGGMGDVIVVNGNPDASPSPVSAVAIVVNDRDGEAVWDKNGERREFESGRINWFGRDEDWRDAIDFRGKRDIGHPLDEWTTMEVLCDGPRIQIRLNGIVVNELSNVRPTNGKITIQSELAELHIRRWELRPLAKASESADLQN